MKKLFTPLIVGLVFAGSVFAQEFTVSYQIIIHDPCGTATYQAATGSFMTGEYFSIPAYTLDPSMADYQGLYDALVGAEFGVQSGALTENITIAVNIMSMDCLDPGFYFDPSGADNPLFMFIGVAVIGEQSGVTPIDEYYYFVQGKFATVTIPLSAAFNAFLELLNVTTNDMAFGYYLNGVWNSGGLSFTVDANNVTLYLSHFSKFGGGKGNLVGVQEELISSTPTKFDMAQNYPNPFNPSTKIQYSIPEEGFVSLKVYNALGAEVADLVNEQKSPGTYEASFNGSELSTGIYFYTIIYNNQIITRKMVLIK